MKTAVEILKALICCAIFACLFFPIWLTLTVGETLANAHTDDLDAP